MFLFLFFGIFLQSSQHSSFLFSLFRCVCVAWCVVWCGGGVLLLPNDPFFFLGRDGRTEEEGGFRSTPKPFFRSAFSFLSWFVGWSVGRVFGFFLFLFPHETTLSLLFFSICIASHCIVCIVLVTVLRAPWCILHLQVSCQKAEAETGAELFWSMLA